MTRLTCGRKETVGKRGCKERWREGGLRRQGGGRPCRGRIGSRQGATGFHSEGVNASGLTKGSRECDERVNMPPAARATSHVRTSHAPQRITDSKGACRLPTRPPAPGCSQCMSSHSAYLRVGNFLRKRRCRGSAHISTRPPLISSLTIRAKSRWLPGRHSWKRIQCPTAGPNENSYPSGRGSRSHARRNVHLMVALDVVVVCRFDSPSGPGVDREHQLQLDFLARCRRRGGGPPIYDDRHLSVRRSGTRTRLVSSLARLSSTGRGRRQAFKVEKMIAVLVSSPC